MPRPVVPCSTGFTRTNGACYSPPFAGSSNFLFAGESSIFDFESEILPFHSPQFRAKKIAILTLDDVH